MSSLNGGAGIAASRIHEALVRHESRQIESTILTTVDMKALARTPRSRRARTLWSQVKRFLVNKILALDCYLSGPGLTTIPREYHSSISDVLNTLKADVVHFHWIGKSSVSMKDIRKLSQPVIWTMHDSWLATAPRHVFSSDRKIRSSVGLLGIVLQSIIRRLVWASLPKMVVVSPSKWMLEMSGIRLRAFSKESYVVPNTLDTRFWAPQEQKSQRERWGFSKEEILVIGFGGGQKDFGIKGGDMIGRIWEMAREHLGQNDSGLIRLVTFGSHNPLADEYPLPHSHLGHLDTFELRDLMSESTVLVYPTLNDNFPNLVLEACAVGLPTLGFDTGGIREILGTYAEQLLVPDEDERELALRIAALLRNPQKLIELSTGIRKSTLGRFGEQAIARQHKDLYIYQDRLAKKNALK